jgi:hypothetical protein
MAKGIQISKSLHGLRVGADIPEAVLEPFIAGMTRVDISFDPLFRSTLATVCTFGNQTKGLGPRLNAGELLRFSPRRTSHRLERKTCRITKAPQCRSLRSHCSYMGDKKIDLLYASPYRDFASS